MALPRGADHSLQGSTDQLSLRSSFFTRPAVRPFHSGSSAAWQLLDPASTKRLTSWPSFLCRHQCDTTLEARRCSEAERRLLRSALAQMALLNRMLLGTP